MLCTRFAPSPTGLLHLGNVRTALLSYLWSMNNKGKFILRFDDTDRVEEEYIKAIRTDLEWMNIKFDKEIFQSERNAIYSKWLEICKEKGIVYPAYETKEELDQLREKLSKEKKPPVFKKFNAKQADDTNPHWRFELPSIKIEWNDAIRGKISINLKSVSDPIVQKSDGSFTYMLTSVIDDIEEKVSHIFRGEDHVTNTAIQIYMFERIANHKVEFGHLPILLNKGGQRMSKRNKDESIQDLRNEGFSAMTLANQMLFIGKSEFHLCKTMEELSKYADSQFSSSQIRWSKKEALKLQNKFIQSLSQNEAHGYFGINFDKWELIKSEISFKQDLEDWKKIFENCDVVSDEKINFKELNIDEKIFEFDKMNIDWNNFIASIRELEHGKIVMKKMRSILTGKKFGPSMIELLENIDIKILKHRFYASIA
ncbi:hypothetical protein FZC35_00655 [Candidatus Cytomitobacter indipagum]|uniref:Glutamyl/glutaminyl-tRNA synthetase class Ib catalytic domain-containing protein n=1 Tax=Candidatus Cytomitobacter indipagum TaxID=2601575 RepID=A0A5C0UCZ4_9PROT|nr:glutamate--tRNA ligase family protein [Candidatus Cytomitobacter indipagum]QEK37896.1 hypothetical protein FZC35_00655 [Candidatus Cytomitobacter indipagum]